MKAKQSLPWYAILEEDPESCRFRVPACLEQQLDAHSRETRGKVKRIRELDIQVHNAYLAGNYELAEELDTHALALSYSIGFPIPTQDPEENYNGDLCGLGTDLDYFEQAVIGDVRLLRDYLGDLCRYTHLGNIKKQRETIMLIRKKAREIRISEMLPKNSERSPVRVRGMTTNPIEKKIKKILWKYGN